MSHSIADLQREEQAVFDDIKELYTEQSDFIVDAILKSIAPSFIDEFMGENSNLEDANEEITITRKRLYDFSGDLYAKVDAVIHLRSALGHFYRIRELKSRIELTNKGILL